VLLDDPVLVNVPLQGRAEPPLSFALKIGCDAKMLSLLLSHGAIVDEPGSNGLTALSSIVSNAADRNMNRETQQDVYPPQCVDLVMAQTLNKLFQYDDQQPPKQTLDFLDNISEDQRMSVVRCLLLNGADPAWKDKAGFSAVEYARRAGRKKVTTFLEYFRPWQASNLHLRMKLLPLPAGISRLVFDNLLPDMFTATKPVEVMQDRTLQAS